MKLVCIQDFGSHKRGETVELPDTDDFSPLYFKKAEEDSSTPPGASPQFTGTNLTKPAQERATAGEAAEKANANPATEDKEDS